MQDTRPPGFASWDQQGLGQPHPEPFLGAGVGVVANRDEPEDARELLLHAFALNWNEALAASS